VVILRLRERTDLGTTFTDVLQRYAHSLRDVHSKLVIVSVNDRLADQLRVTGLTDLLGPENLYRGSERIGASLEHAHRDAVTWVAQQAQSDDGNDR
jgi:SulP family sulfate permease